MLKRTQSKEGSINTLPSSYLPIQDEQLLELGKEWKMKINKIRNFDINIEDETQDLEEILKRYSILRQELTSQSLKRAQEEVVRLGF